MDIQGKILNEIDKLYVTEKFLHEYHHLELANQTYILSTEKELISMGTFQSNEYALAIVKMQSKPLDISNLKVVIALDDVSDPGNLGTIIRIADWYGIDTIVASEDTADFYNPKVINASMGSFTRVSVHNMDLGSFFIANTTHRVYGAVLDGKNIHKIQFSSPLILFMGNESKGINSSWMKYIDEKITIPRIGQAESLNVAVSTAITCDNIMR